MPSSSTRERIVEQADALFYQGGFEATSFHAIASGVGISRGNFYHHFKSKDAILDAVISRRADATRAMLAGWEAEGGDARGQILCFIRILLTNRAAIMDYGCPVGTLTNELAKAGHPAREEAAAIFTLFRDWLAARFQALGAGEEADAHALHLLAWSQGVATLAAAFRDTDFIDREIAAITAWLDARIALPSSPPADKG
ncbi:TetR/AcrR family transcriptional regulator [Sphingopyxis sp. MWB1]|uniref:TetR/AcrR family transcriptional regulator n=1 Tax=Sphingopyxis sp. MWB1 TaxID=1537715 RepID=UPI00051A364D|nr:TetR/AcrR family transcriptional regulator [Sphingopyxis sp. MWB1]